MSDLEKVTSELGKNHKEFKTAEKKKNESRKEFFELANEAHEEEETSFVVIFAPTLEDAQAEIERRFSMCDVVAATGSDGEYSFELRTKDEFRPFTYVNHADGMVYKKQIAYGPLHLDEERLLEDDPELYERVTYVPEPERQMKDPDDIDQDDFARLSDYLYSGKPTVKLASPRKAKPEELDD